jgi:DtxR family transcriptional regulator, Mn-dependent transcriptional regulator
VTSWAWGAPPGAGRPPRAAARGGRRGRVERVSDRDSDALRYLDTLGVRPGTVLEVGERDPFGGPLWVEVEGVRHALGVPLARLVHGTVDSAR